MKPPFPSLTATWHNTCYSAIDPSKPELSLKGKTVLLTGGSRGIGRATAKHFAQAGTSILGLTARTLAALEPVKADINKDYPETQVLIFGADVLDVPALNKAFEAVKAASPDRRGIDILVQNAGYFSAHAMIGDPEADDEENWRSYEINLRGSYNVTRAFLANMHQKSQDGSHEPQLIASNSGGICFYPPPPGFSAYLTSMVAKARFFESVATEYPDVRVVSVHPGAVGTDMGKKAEAGGLKLPEDDGKSSLAPFFPSPFAIKWPVL